MKVVCLGHVAVVWRQWEVRGGLGRCEGYLLAHIGRVGPPGDTGR